LSKDTRPKRCPNTERREESKEMKDSTKVEKGGVIVNAMKAIA
jgi:hypothetical protein